jgi:hypothetical protein
MSCALLAAIHTARVFCAGLNVDAIFPAFEGAPLWPRRVFA